MAPAHEDILAERQRLRAKFPGLFDFTAALFLRHDPIGINFITNTDEYEPEVGTVLPRLRDCHSEADVCSVLHEEFIRWFDVGTAGPRERYHQIAGELWASWSKFTAT